MSSEKAIDRDFASLHEGDEAYFTKAISVEDVDAFAEVSGDKNPLHVDNEYASGTPFRSRVVHGMLMAALVSRLIGMQLPGVRSLLVKESMEFRQPVYIADNLKVSGKILSKSESTRLLEIAVSITRQDVVVARGSVHVKVR
jgi:acyl dehydratase